MKIEAGHLAGLSKIFDGILFGARIHVKKKSKLKDFFVR
jgi:hypothetical protein